MERWSGGTIKRSIQWFSSLVENLEIFVVRGNAAEIAPGGLAGNCRVLPGARCRRERMNGFKLDVRHAHSRPIVFRKLSVGKNGVSFDDGGKRQDDQGKSLNIEHSTSNAQHRTPIRYVGDCRRTRAWFFWPMCQIARVGASFAQAMEDWPDAILDKDR